MFRPTAVPFPRERQAQESVESLRRRKIGDTEDDEIQAPITHAASPTFYARTRVGRMTIGMPSHCKRRWSEYAVWLCRKWPYHVSR